jgi:hypothetical protein
MKATISGLVGVCVVAVSAVSGASFFKSANVDVFFDGAVAAGAAITAGAAGGLVLWPANVSAFFTTPESSTTLTWTAAVTGPSRQSPSTAASATVPAALKYSIAG